MCVGTGLINAEDGYFVFVEPAIDAHLDIVVQHGNSN